MSNEDLTEDNHWPPPPTKPVVASAFDSSLVNILPFMSKVALYCIWAAVIANFCDFTITCLEFKNSFVSPSDYTEAMATIRRYVGDIDHYSGTVINSFTLLWFYRLFEAQRILNPNYDPLRSLKLALWLALPFVGYPIIGKAIVSLWEDVSVNREDSDQLNQKVTFFIWSAMAAEFVCDVALDVNRYDDYVFPQGLHWHVFLYSHLVFEGTYLYYDGFLIWLITAITPRLLARITTLQIDKPGESNKVIKVNESSA